MTNSSYILQKTSSQALIPLVGSRSDLNESFRGNLLCFRCGITRNIGRNSLFFTLISCFIDLTMFTT
ncbi:hypothetical protein Hanom_Chr01g00043551 [Helianthus anomalus]